MSTKRYGYEGDDKRGYEIAPFGEDGLLDWSEEYCVTADGDEDKAKRLTALLNLSEGISTENLETGAVVVPAAAATYANKILQHLDRLRSMPPGSTLTVSVKDAREAEECRQTVEAFSAALSRLHELARKEAPTS